MGRRFFGRSRPRLREAVDPSSGLGEARMRSRWCGPRSDVTELVAALWREGRVRALILSVSFTASMTPHCGRTRLDPCQRPWLGIALCAS